MTSLGATSASSSSAAAAASPAAVIVLAAGAGTRMKSRLPKVLHPIAGRPLVWHALSSAAALAPGRLVAVLGHGRDEVQAYLDGATGLPAVTVAVQDEQRGTGHAVACALEATGALDGTVVVTYGDVPLLRSQTLQVLLDEHRRTDSAVTVLSAIVPDPTGYGRIVRDADGQVAGIVEHKDADDAQRAITEINSGVYAFDGRVLADALTRLSDSNAAGEQYLTEVVEIARGDGRRVGGVVADDAVETEGVNDRVQLADLARVLNDRIVRGHQRAGVTVQDPATTWIHADVTIGADTVLLPGTSLEAGTVVGSGCTVGPDTTLVECTVDDGATVVRSQAQGARIGARASVGPFSYLRPGADLGADSKVGAFVEVKKTTIGEGSKVPHLSYVGDTSIGAGVNVGAGTITANYDGAHKFGTVIGDHSFVGSNTTLIAPVRVGDGAYVAAGSAITGDLAPGELGVARGRQRNIPGWVPARKPDSAAARAAAAAGGPESGVSEPGAAEDNH